MATLNQLSKATEAATKAQERADQLLAKRDDIAADLAEDPSIRYQDLAAAMKITVDGVTYVLRKVRARRAQ